MLYIKAGTFIYIYLTVSIARMLVFVVLLTRLQCVVQSSSIPPQNLLIGCRPVTSSFSDDPLTQFTAKPFLRCKQAREATYRCQRLKVNIYVTIL